MSNGTTLLVPASLDTITTYILLEQESWFEKETEFLPRLLTPGATVLDIGSNVGVYSLPLARCLGSTGKVYSYEPGVQPRRLLENSCVLNNLTNICVLGHALSNRVGRASLAPAVSSELRSLTETSSNDGETVDVTALDEEERIHQWGRIDFVKIDAEGEERRILEGGQRFFAQQSPLVMFEVKAQDRVDKGISDAFCSLGYEIFRLLPGAPILVPVIPDERLDTFELNLFAAKPDRVSRLVDGGWLVGDEIPWLPNADARSAALELLRRQAFGPALSRMTAPAVGSPYHDALAGYAQWRLESSRPSERYAALRFSHAVLRQLCGSQNQLEWFSTFARVAWDLGDREGATAALVKILALAKGNVVITQPFWPAGPRFDQTAPGSNIAHWFVVSALEQLERAAGHSSMFVQPYINLDWLRQQPFVSTEMERRHVLRFLRGGKRLAVPRRLTQPAIDHVNADLWRSGVIPNTFVNQ